MVTRALKFASIPLLAFHFVAFVTMAAGIDLGPSRLGSLIMLRVWILQVSAYYLPGLGVLLLATSCWPQSGSGSSFCWFPVRTGRD